MPAVTHIAKKMWKLPQSRPRLGLFLRFDIIVNTLYYGVKIRQDLPNVGNENFYRGIFIKILKIKYLTCKNVLKKSRILTLR